MIRVLEGDVREILPTLPADSFDCIVTSPPYFGLRDYGVEGQIGLESALPEYLDTMVAVCRELRRVLKPQGTFWLNIGDSYAGSWGARGRRETASDDSSWHISQIKNHPKRASGTGIMKMAGLKPKDLMMVPARLALALQADGWWVRSEIVWHKPNPMPESITDRPTSAHKKIFLLTKNERYFFDAAAVREADSGRPSGNGFVRQHRLSYDGRGAEEQWLPGGGRNIRNVWTMATQPFKEAHFATFPPEIAERCIKAGCPASGHVLDPFGVAGTSGLVADRLQRDATLIELNPEYADLARRRISGDAPLFAEAI